MRSRDLTHVCRWFARDVLRTAEQLREATAQANEESQRAQLAEERVKELEAALVRKDYELKEQALVTEQLRSVAAKGPHVGHKQAAYLMLDPSLGPHTPAKCQPRRTA